MLTRIKVEAESRSELLPQSTSREEHRDCGSNSASALGATAHLHMIARVKPETLNSFIAESLTGRQLHLSIHISRYFLISKCQLL